MSNVIDIKTIDKLKKLQFKRKKKTRLPTWVKHLNGLRVTVEWYDQNDEITSVVFDPNNPFMSLTKEGKLISIEFLQSVICCICDEPDIAAEYTRFLERAYRYLKDSNDEKT